MRRFKRPVSPSVVAIRSDSSYRRVRTSASAACSASMESSFCADSGRPSALREPHTRVPTVASPALRGKIFSAPRPRTTVPPSKMTTRSMAPSARPGSGAPSLTTLLTSPALSAKDRSRRAPPASPATASTRWRRCSASVNAQRWSAGHICVACATAVSAACCGVVTLFSSSSARKKRAFSSFSRRTAPSTRSASTARATSLPSAARTASSSSENGASRSAASAPISAPSRPVSGTPQNAGTGARPW